MAPATTTLTLPPSRFGGSDAADANDQRCARQDSGRPDEPDVGRVAAQIQVDRVVDGVDHAGHDESQQGDRLGVGPPQGDQQASPMPIWKAPTSWSKCSA